VDRERDVLLGDPAVGRGGDGVEHGGERRGRGRRADDDAAAARDLEDAVRRARDGGAGLLVVTAAPAAEAFYARCGFRTVGEAPTRFGPAIRMHRDLAS
jgi:hypothetical protein